MSRQSRRSAELISSFKIYGPTLLLLYMNDFVSSSSVDGVDSASYDGISVFAGYFSFVSSRFERSVRFKL